jgi:sulfur relay (sulfurtransferase) DsrF/TusC family protein
LTVLAIPPTFTLQPTNQSALSGSNATFITAAVGPTPISFQWQFLGTNITWATNAQMTLTNVHLVSQGSYDVVASNSFGFTTSSNAILTVTGFPPSNLTIQPTNQPLVTGSNFTFSVTANGSTPFSYQWQFLGTNITWATSATLTLTNAQFTNEGGYDVIVGNDFGSVTSSIVPLLSFATALNSLLK